MKAALLQLLLVSLVLVNGCRSAKYRATATISIQRTDSKTCDESFYQSQVSVIMELGVKNLSNGGSISMEHKRASGIICIHVAHTSPAYAAEVCNKVAQAYVSRKEEGIEKKLIERASVPLEPM